VAEAGQAGVLQVSRQRHGLVFTRTEQSNSHRFQTSLAGGRINGVRQDLRRIPGITSSAA
jgi:hypothetical protein